MTNEFAPSPDEEFDPSERHLLETIYVFEMYCVEGGEWVWDPINVFLSEHKAMEEFKNRKAQFFTCRIRRIGLLHGDDKVLAFGSYDIS